MKRTILCALAALVAAIVVAGATLPSRQEPETYADIKFDTLTISLGTFSASDPKHSCSFGFTNTGNAPLIINQAYASCGCTVATYTKTPVQPGERGTVDVTYNGKGKTPGHFKKVVSVRSNARKEMVRLTIEGDMKASK